MLESRKPISGNPGDTGDPMDPVLRSLEERGYASIPGFLDPDSVSELVFEMDTLKDGGEFHRAGVGSGTLHQVNSEIRSDSIFWFDSTDPSPVRKKYLDAILPVRDRIGEHFRMPLAHEEFFYAVYPKGGFYKKHYDNFHGSSRRLLTGVLYLNEDWQVGDGGALRIHRPAKRDLPWVPGFPTTESELRIRPESGTLALFLTLLIPHSVEKANRERRSIVSWFGSSPDDPLLSQL